MLVTAPLLPRTAHPSATLTIHPDTHPHRARPARPCTLQPNPNASQADEALLKQHYKDLVEKPFFPSLLEYMMSGPVTCMVWEG